MNRLFTFLIISILFSQSAWAIYDVEFNHIQEPAHTQASYLNDDANECIDHCSHACSHLVAFISNNTFDAYSSPDKNLTTLTNITSSISYQPPVPPPTV